MDLGLLIFSCLGHSLGEAFPGLEGQRAEALQLQSPQDSPESRQEHTRPDRTDKRMKVNN